MRRHHQASAYDRTLELSRGTVSSGFRPFVGRGERIMKRIWVVDDMIPVHELYGALPVPTRLDSEIVLGLVNQVPRERWEEGEVLELCRSLCTPAFEAAFFRSPEAMLQAARQGAVPPHAVVFDWEYPGSNDERNLQALERLLLNSFAYVQVYTHLGGASADPH